MKIAFFDSKQYDIESFNNHINSDIEIKYFEEKLNHNTVELAKGYDVICVFVNDIVDKIVIDKLYTFNIKLISLRCAGYNNVDVEYAYKKIHIVHVPAYSPYAVAEHAMALLLCLNRKIYKSYNRTKEFNFSLNNLIGFDLHDKTIGIIGTGKIGSVMCNICSGFGMNILAYDKYINNTINAKYVSLNELLKNSDIISLHCPLNSETDYLINKNSIKKMKKGVVIINTSRGRLINTEDLIDGLKSNKIDGAGLDVYEEESDIFYNDYSNKIIDDDTLCRLITMPNVIVTGHQAFLTREALDNIAITTINNILTFFKNKSCENELCYRCGSIEHCKNSKNERCF